MCAFLGLHPLPTSSSDVRSMRNHSSLPASSLRLRIAELLHALVVICNVARASFGLNPNKCQQPCLNNCYYVIQVWHGFPYIQGVRKLCHCLWRAEAISVRDGYEPGKCRFMVCEVVRFMVCEVSWNTNLYELSHLMNWFMVYEVTQLAKVIPFKWLLQAHGMQVKSKQHVRPHQVHFWVPFEFTCQLHCVRTTTCKCHLKLTIDSLCQHVWPSNHMKNMVVCGRYCCTNWNSQTTNQAWFITNYGLWASLGPSLITATTIFTGRYDISLWHSAC